MAERTINTPRTTRDVRRLFREMARELSATKQGQLTRLFMGALAHGLFKRIHRAFVVKSRGRADDLGISWRPLKRETIAQRPIGGQSRRARSFRARQGRGLLTAAQDRVWRGIFASTLARLTAQGVSVAEAKSSAGRLAWAVLKSQGAKTRLGTLGGRKVRMLVVSGDLQRSIEPGRLGRFSYSPPNRLQLFEIRGKQLVIGSRLPYANRQNRMRTIIPGVRKMRPWFVQSLQEAVRVTSLRMEEVARRR